MKKLLSSILVTVFVIIIVLSFCACSTSPIIGTWEKSQGAMYVKIEIKANKTFVFERAVIGLIVLSGTWEYDEVADKYIFNATETNVELFPDEFWASYDADTDEIELHIDDYSDHLSRT